MTFTQQEPTRPIIILGIAIALLSYVIVGILSGLLAQHNLPADNILLISRLALWFSFAAICIYSLKVERRSIIIWKEQQYLVWGYVLSVLSVLGAIFFGLLLITLLVKLIGLPINSNSKHMESLVLIFKRNKFLLVFSALTAGITEELIFRAYIMPRLLIFFKNAYLPIVVSALFFGLMHVSYGTLMQVLGPFYIGVIFGIYYYKFRNIKVLIVCHFLWDLIALLVKTR